MPSSKQNQRLQHFFSLFSSKVNIANFNLLVKLIFVNNVQNQRRCCVRWRRWSMLELGEQNKCLLMRTDSSILAHPINYLMISCLKSYVIYNSNISYSAYRYCFHVVIPWILRKQSSFNMTVCLGFFCGQVNFKNLKLL